MLQFICLFIPHALLDSRCEASQSRPRYSGSFASLCHPVFGPQYRAVRILQCISVWVKAPLSPQFPPAFNSGECTETVLSNA